MRHSALNGPLAPAGAFHSRTRYTRSFALRSHARFFAIASRDLSACDAACFETMRDNQKLQNEFLNQLRKTATPVSVFLKTGERLDGQIKSFDIYSLSLNCPEPRLVVKSVIATVQPAPRHAKKAPRKKMPPVAHSEPMLSVPVARAPRKAPEVVTKRRRLAPSKP